MITKSNLNKTVSFLQEFIAEVQLGLHVSELSADEIRQVMLANAKMLVSEGFRTTVPEVSGQKKVHRKTA